jgi:hypothetical protein
VNTEIADRIQVYPEDDLPCAVAHYVAAEMKVAPLQVGQTANDVNVRISMCQLGLFGYAVKGKPAYRILSPMENVPEDLANAIREALVDGRVPCVALWRIAKEFNLSRHEAGNAIEALGIKVKPCQLGCF